MFEQLPEPHQRRSLRATVFFAAAFAFVAGAYFQRAKYEHWDSGAVIFCGVWGLVAIAWTLMAMRLSRQRHTEHSNGAAAR